jgi:pilus assembly protein Flp/PilA
MLCKKRGVSPNLGQEPREATQPEPTQRKEQETMKNIMMRLWKEEEGQDLIEYALLIVLIALAAAAIFPTVGTSINTVFTNANTCLTTQKGC